MSKAVKAGRPKGSSKEATLAKILPAARKLFADKGYAQTTFKDVGAAVGMSHAAVYSYFPSKKELYLAAVADTQAMLLPHYFEVIEKGYNLKESISHILLATAREHDKDNSITGLLAAVPIEMHRHEELYESLSEENNLLMNTLESIFEKAKASGEINSDAPASRLVSALFGGGVGVALFQYGFEGDNLTSTMEVFVSLIEGGFFN